MTTCNRCGYEHELNAWDIAMKCKAVKSIEYGDGGVKSITFYDPLELTIKYTPATIYPHLDPTRPNTIHVGDTEPFYKITC